MPIPNEWDLTGKNAIITADRRGWTPHLASALAEAGANVAVAGSERSDMAAAVAAVEKQGRKSVAIATDIMDAASVSAMADRAVAELGGVDILVNGAAAEFGKRFEDVSETEWQTLMDFNVKSMFLCSQAVGRTMLAQGSGRIVNIGSGLAVRGLGNSVAACAAQGAIHQFTSALALEWGRNGIRVNSIGAGWLTTDEPTEESQKELLVRYLPSRRKGHPNDLATLLVYLASDACDFVTGQTIFIDGGALAHA
ncbi:MAG: SDR family oxidoreductase [SAR202 cluster bacterium]|jgi:NAD(P)-dependent dehydrogenase (short-subunit alcohol dehydrogenase family)|nr:2-deoxy-D-gluconate 3-dehydrogenase [Chloroflexota bacterium]MDP6421937.1 SDR family oxidoreductase [SAR202 cluster bacterium]HAL49315.1 2-deoxy-D-gluconate 3-dehydrogenase [Dehalococcoidia bacterium]MDP6663391.1 SDR family oxidoreductase [SAR202 cluster bacterium]MQG59354.1 SDR family oxidoreductase [SAR202 cluster bacterium]|tara:strand:- start:1578 stop:2336 length:759 start_codon:yes stop_codon:yes gene_type:complete